MAATTPLASIDDVKAAFGGRALTSEEEVRAGEILVKASELFRLHAGQKFTLGQSEVRLRVSGGKVYLPQRPVTSVESVVDDDGRAVAYTRFKQWLTVNCPGRGFVIVTYSHGEQHPPELVRVTVADIAKKVLSISPRAAAGQTQHQEMVGPYTSLETYATWAQGGQTILSPDDRAIAESYRFKPPKSIVMSP